MRRPTQSQEASNKALRAEDITGFQVLGLRAYLQPPLRTLHGLPFKGVITNVL